MTDPPQLSDLIDPDAATRRLRDAGMAVSRAAPTYIRYKPGETTIIAYRLTHDDGETWGYAHSCTNPDRATEIHAKATTLRPRPSPVGPGLVRLDSHTVFYGFPNDARLRKLRWYTTPRKLKRSLAGVISPCEQISARRSAVAILRYKPERRVVAKIDLATGGGLHRYLLRYSTQRQAEHLAATAQHLRTNGVPTPMPVAQLADGRVAIDRFIAGEQLRETVRRDGLGDGTDLAAALVGFHTTTPPEQVPRRQTGHELARARVGLAGLTAWERALARRAAAVATLLARTQPRHGRGEVLLHGDLHAKNILVYERDIAFVDLERVAIGPAAIDLGYFRAHAIAHAIREPGESPTAGHYAETMLDAYQLATRPIDVRELGWHTAIGLVDQALLVTRHLESGWRQTSAELLDAARAQLDQRTLTAAAP